MRSLVRSCMLGTGLVISVVLGACAGSSDDTGSDETNVTASGYTVDLAKLNEQFPPPEGGREIEKIEDAYTVTVDLGVAKFEAKTHLFGDRVNVIPYADPAQGEATATVLDAAGNPHEHDEAIAKFFRPGEVGYMIKHHRPASRVLNFQDQSNDMKEHLKLQDTHIGIVVGIERDGQAGAITVNNPQGYQGGAFGDEHYQMIFVKPKLPEYVPTEAKQAVIDNIRTMLLGFNAVSEFPGDYNGGDPLAARTPELVTAHVVKMVQAIAGDEEARAWFKEKENLIYCAELAHVSTSAGLLVPLNDATMVPLVGEETWTTFKGEVKKHNEHAVSAFTSLNRNPYVAFVQLALAPEDLQSVPAYADSPEETEKLAFNPMTMSDIVEQFLRLHIPREEAGEQLAQAQAAVLQAMKPGLFEAMAIEDLPDTDPVKMAVSDLFDRIVAVVGTPHESYAAFREDIKPLLAEARKMTGPRSPDAGVGLFVPPSLLHVVLQGKNPGGLVGLEYLGHGIHMSATLPE